MQQLSAALQEASHRATVRDDEPFAGAAAASWLQLQEAKFSSEQVGTLVG
jgi:hypothetical protein